ncbi:hypothetical protein COX05_03820 [candidate division WWE3 bacterium CG22_combo_CG10-13_8_21_14_all_39_12]|uniref:Uncharacterized protein n=2 Tax=Katanobacteria TaxID=422282 RepID=A0A2M7X1P1_UNCKA|nr:MAG: hypothetical protein COX05_03820 [candidate division WWE3 bacterium CG22_combo_CG10-13_8_21_14_all_39_12]PJA40096.1 MAG: hypothetical protein CO179_03370 [candidate division WWE3 bacterium CG_4_9_14_3_um_filter_39_7]
MGDILKDFILAFVITEFLFAYLEYRYRPDLIYILGRLFAPKYIAPALIIPTAYVVLKLLLGFLF